jgi:hypothetical protein
VEETGITKPEVMVQTPEGPQEWKIIVNVFSNSDFFFNG